MKKQILVLARLIFAIFLVASIASSALARGEDYQTGFKRWRTADGDFDGWSMTAGTTINASGELTFDLATAGNKVSDPFAEGAYEGGNYYNAGEFYVGEATSPVMQTGFNFTEAIASWNANTPEGSWIEVQFRAQYGSRWSKWYVLGIWASGTTAIQRHSVRLQGDTDGFVATDTFVSSNKKETSNAFQVKMRLFSEDGTAIPTVRNASVAYSTTTPKKASASIPTAASSFLNLPECSQMVYPDGGEVWCSPTSMSMVLSFWNNYTGQCEPRVRAAVDGVYDWVYDGHGNWPFNTAYAASQVVAQNGETRNLEAYVARFTSLAKAEEYIAAGIPVVVSFAWKNGDLEGSAIPSSNGHLAVLVGFDAQGNPIINDPAASTNEDVQRTYRRSEFEPLWLTSSGGTVYLVYPEGHPAPSLY
jgi:hypothetical protein